MANKPFNLTAKLNIQGPDKAQIKSVIAGVHKGLSQTTGITLSVNMAKTQQEIKSKLKNINAQVIISPSAESRTKIKDYIGKLSIPINLKPARGSAKNISLALGKVNVKVLPTVGAADKAAFARSLGNIPISVKIHANTDIAKNKILSTLGKLSTTVRINVPKDLRSRIQNSIKGIKTNIRVDISSRANVNLSKFNTQLRETISLLNQVSVAASGASTSLSKMVWPVSGLRHIGVGGGGRGGGKQTFIGQIGGEAQQATGRIEEFGSVSALALRRFMGFSLAAGAFMTVVYGIKSGVAEAISFEREMVKVQQVTGRTEQGLSVLKDTIGELGTAFGTSSKELMNVTRLLSQAGLTSRDTAIALEAIARADLAPTFNSMAETTEGVIASMRQFNRSALETNATLGSLNAVAGKFAVESSDLISVIRRTGGAFTAAGGSLEELLALFTSVRATTRESAETIATGFRTIFTRLQRPRTIGFLRDLGIELQDTKGQFIGAFQAVEQLHLAMKNLDPKDVRFARIIEELGGFRQVSKVIPLIQQFDLSSQALQVALAGTNSTIEDSIIAQQSLMVQTQKVGQEFQKLFRDMTASETFRDWANYALTMAKALADVARQLEAVMPLLTNMAVFIGLTAGGRFMMGFKSNVFPAGAIKKARGGAVPGTGHGDKVRALLEPGEFVIRKDAAEKIGYDKLYDMNRGKKVRMHDGGQVGVRRMNDGGIISSSEILQRKMDELEQSFISNYRAPKKPIQDAKADLHKLISTRKAGEFARLAEARRKAGVPARSITSDIEKAEALVRAKRIEEYRVRASMGLSIFGDEGKPLPANVQAQSMKQSNAVLQKEGFDYQRALNEYNKTGTATDSHGRVLKSIEEIELLRSGGIGAVDYSDAALQAGGKTAEKLAKRIEMQRLQKARKAAIGGTVADSGKWMQTDRAATAAKEVKLFEQKPEGPLTKYVRARRQGKGFRGLPTSQPGVSGATVSYNIDVPGMYHFGAGGIKKVDSTPTQRVKGIATEEEEARNSQLGPQVSPGKQGPLGPSGPLSSKAESRTAQWRKLEEQSQRRVYSDSFIRDIRSQQQKIEESLNPSYVKGLKTRYRGSDVVSSNEMKNAVTDGVAKGMTKPVVIEKSASAIQSGVTKGVSPWINNPAIVAQRPYEGGLFKRHKGNVLGGSRGGMGATSVVDSRQNIPTTIVTHNIPTMLNRGRSASSRNRPINAQMQALRDADIAAEQAARQKLFSSKKPLVPAQQAYKQQRSHERALHRRRQTMQNFLRVPTLQDAPFNEYRYQEGRTIKSGERGYIIPAPPTVPQPNILPFGGGRRVDGPPMHQAVDDKDAPQLSRKYRQLMLNNTKAFTHFPIGYKYEPSGKHIRPKVYAGPTGKVARGQFASVGMPKFGSMNMMMGASMFSMVLQQYANGLDESEKEMKKSIATMTEWIMVMGAASMAMNMLSTSSSFVSGFITNVLSKNVAGFAKGNQMRNFIQQNPNMASWSGFSLKQGGQPPSNMTKFNRFMSGPMLMGMSGFTVAIGAAATAVALFTTWALIAAKNNKKEAREIASDPNRDFRRTWSGDRLTMRDQGSFDKSVGLMYTAQSQRRSGIGAAGGAVAGAVMGSPFGPPGILIGLLVGGIVGGLGGLIHSWITGTAALEKEMRALNRESRFTKAIETLETDLQRLTSGDIDARSSAELARTGTNLRESLDTLSLERTIAQTDEDKAKAAERRRSIIQQVPALDQLKRSLIESSDTIEDFTSAGGAGAEIIRALAEGQGRSISELTQEIKKEIEDRKKSRELSSAALDAAESFGILVQSIHQFSNQILGITQELEGLARKASTTESLVSSQFTVPAFTGQPGFGDFAKMMEGNLPANIMDNYRLATRQLTGDDDITNRVMQIGTIMQDLPDILRSTAQEGPLNEEGRTIDFFKDKFDEMFAGRAGFTSKVTDDGKTVLTGQGGFVRDVLAKGLDDLLSTQRSGEGTSFGEFAAMARTDPAGLMAKIGADQFNALFARMDGAAQNVLSAVQNMDAVMQARARIELMILDKNLELLKMTGARERTVFELRNPNPRLQFGLARTQQQKASQVQTALQGTGAQGAAWNDVEAIGLRLRSVTGSIQKLDEQIKSVSDIEKLPDLSQQMAAQNTEAERLRRALSILADTTEEAAEIRNTLNKLEEQKKSGYDLLDQYMFETREGRQSILKSIAQTVAVTSGQVPFEMLPDKDRAGVGAMLRRYDNVQVPLAGLNASGEFNTGMEGRLALMLKRYAKLIRPGMGKFGVDDINPLQRSPQEEAQINALNVILERQEKVQQQLIADQQSLNTSLITDMGTTFSKFSNDLRGIMNGVVRSFYEGEKSATEAQINIIKKQQSDIGAVRQIIERQPMQGLESLTDAGVVKIATAISAQKENIGFVLEDNKIQEQLKGVSQNLVKAMLSGGGDTIKTTEALQREVDLKYAFPSLNETQINTIQGKMVQSLVSGYNTGNMAGKNIFGGTLQNPNTGSPNAVVQDVESLLIAMGGAVTPTIMEEKFNKLRAIGNAMGLDVTSSNQRQLLKFLRNTYEEMLPFGEALKEVSGSEGISGLTEKLNTLQAKLKEINGIMDKMGGGGGVVPPAAAPMSLGGSVFKSRGTDTVPAMLTPGEFVVNAESTRKNRDLLQEINSDKSTVYAAGGGFVDYFSKGYSLLWKDIKKQAGKEKQLATSSFWRDAGTDAYRRLPIPESHPMHLDYFDNLSATFDRDDKERQIKIDTFRSRQQDAMEGRSTVYRKQDGNLVDHKMAQAMVRQGTMNKTEYEAYLKDRKKAKHADIRSRKPKIVKQLDPLPKTNATNGVASNSGNVFTPATMLSSLIFGATDNIHTASGRIPDIEISRPAKSNIDFDTSDLPFNLSGTNNPLLDEFNPGHLVPEHGEEWAPFPIFDDPFQLPDKPDEMPSPSISLDPSVKPRSQIMEERRHQTAVLRKQREEEAKRLIRGRATSKARSRKARLGYSMPSDSSAIGTPAAAPAAPGEVVSPATSTPGVVVSPATSTPGVVVSPATSTPGAVETPVVESWAKRRRAQELAEREALKTRRGTLANKAALPKWAMEKDGVTPRAKGIYHDGVLIPAKEKVEREAGVYENGTLVRAAKKVAPKKEAGIYHNGVRVDMAGVRQRLDSRTPDLAKKQSGGVEQGKFWWDNDPSGVPMPVSERDRMNMPAWQRGSYQGMITIRESDQHQTIIGQGWEQSTEGRAELSLPQHERKPWIQGITTQVEGSTEQQLRDGIETRQLFDGMMPPDRSSQRRFRQRRPISAYDTKPTTTPVDRLNQLKTGYDAIVEELGIGQGRLQTPSFNISPSQKSPGNYYANNNNIAISDKDDAFWKARETMRPFMNMARHEASHAIDYQLGTKKEVDGKIVHTPLSEVKNGPYTDWLDRNREILIKQLKTEFPNIKEEKIQSNREIFAELLSGNSPKLKELRSQMFEQNQPLSMRGGKDAVGGEYRAIIRPDGSYQVYDSANNSLNTQSLDMLEKSGFKPHVFHSGGMVPGSGNQHAILQGGEFVLSKPVVQSLAKGGAVQAASTTTTGVSIGANSNAPQYELKMSSEAKATLESFSQSLLQGSQLMGVAAKEMGELPAQIQSSVLLMNSGIEGMRATFNVFVESSQLLSSNLELFAANFTSSINESANVLNSSFATFGGYISEFVASLGVWNQGSTKFNESVVLFNTAATLIQGAAVTMRDALAQEVRISVTHTHEPLTVNVQGGESTTEGGEAFAEMVMRVVGPVIDNMKKRMRDSGPGIA